MKAPPKMIVSSSPGREKLPAPPFMRLLRGKGGSRSRGRSSSSFARSSPMFVGRRRSSVEIQENKEPGSPKVTCIGQVRIKKKNKKKQLSGTERSSSVREQSDEKQQGTRHEHSHGCRCLQRSLFCNPFTRLPKAKKKKSRVQPALSPHHQRRRSGSIWRRWFSPGCSAEREQEGKEQKKLLEVEEGFNPQRLSLSRFGESLDPEDWRREEEKEEEEKAGAEETKGFAPSTPPKNALLLMRCRSAPQHASSLTSRFWVPEDDSAPTGINAGLKEGDPLFNIDDILGRAKEGGGGDESKSSRNSDSQEDGSCDDNSREEDAEEAAAAGVGPSPSFSSRPLILTRCKSAPATKVAKLAATAPEAPSSFWSSNTTSNGKYLSDYRKSKGCLAQANESFPPPFTK